MARARKKSGGSAVKADGRTKRRKSGSKSSGKGGKAELRPLAADEPLAPAKLPFGVATRVGELPSCLTNVPAGVPIRDLDALFKQKPPIPGVAVVADGRLAGMVSREHFLMTMLAPGEGMGGLDGDIGGLLDPPPPLVVDEATDIETAVGQALSRRPKGDSHPLVVAFQDGQYGVLDMHVLLSALAVLLESRNEQLKQAQARLIQNEKMASLGGLVAGVAHEISTPLGIVLGTASHFADLVNGFDEKLSAKALKRSELERFLKDAREAAQLIEMNASRAANLVQSFKQVSADQTSGERRQFDLRRALYETMVAMSPKWKHRPIRISAQCREFIACDTYPGALSQVLTNLLTNSLLHGFEGDRAGAILITAECQDEDNVLLTYTDNGKGIPRSLQTRVFDPFFTTKRNRGGTGLGLHVVYNLVTKVLMGTLNMSSTENKGVQFQIQFPRCLPVATAQAAGSRAGRS